MNLKEINLNERDGPIPKNFRYVPMIQQKGCCVAACISMIMLKHRIPLVPQELLFDKLGISTLPHPAIKKVFWNPIKPECWCAGKQSEEKRINKALGDLNIPLSMRIISLNQLADPRSYLKKIENRDWDVLAAFNYSMLYEKRPGDYNHVSVIDRVDLKRNEVRLVDPIQTEESSVWRVVRIEQLLRAIKCYNYFGGFWKFGK